MFHPFVVYRIFCDTCGALFKESPHAGIAPIIDPKPDDFCRWLLRKHGWQVKGDATLCPEHVDSHPRDTPRDETHLEADNRRLRFENDRLHAQIEKLTNRKKES